MDQNIPKANLFFFFFEVKFYVIRFKYPIVSEKVFPLRSNDFVVKSDTLYM